MPPYSTILQKKREAIWSRILRPGAENHVFQYKKYYYKFPNYPSICHGTPLGTYDSMRKGYRMIIETFGKDFKIVPTKIYHHGKHYFLKQRISLGKKITLEDIQNPLLRTKLLRLIELNDQLWQEHGLSLDLLGSEILTDPSQIHNLFWDGENIHLFDFGL